jgi:hypothetical protein
MIYAADQTGNHYSPMSLTLASQIPIFNDCMSAKVVTADNHYQTRRWHTSYVSAAVIAGSTPSVKAHSNDESSGAHAAPVQNVPWRPCSAYKSL